MKRFIVLLLVILSAVLFIAIPAMATASYSLSLSVANTGSAYSNYPFIDSFDVAYLVSSGRISSTGLDTQVMDGATSLPRMLADDKILFVGGVGAGTTKNFSLTAGNAPASTMPIVVGNGGYITTSDNATLEPGSNFTLTFPPNTYYDTSAGSNRNILYKEHALKIYVSSAGNIRAAMLDATDAEVVTVTLAVSTGTHSLVVSGDGVNLSIAVDGGTAATAAIGSGIPDSSYAWIRDQNNVMPYFSGVNLTLTTTASNPQVKPLKIAYNGGYIYVPDQFLDDIYKIDATNMTKVSTLHFGTPANGYETVCAANGYVYAFDYNNNLIKWDVSSGAVVTSVDYLSTYSISHMEWMQEYSGFLYVVDDDLSSPRILVIDESNLSLVTTISDASFQFNDNTQIAIYSGYIYVPTSTSSKLAKIALSGYAVSTLSLVDGSDTGVDTYGVAINTGYIYTFGGINTSGHYYPGIFKIDPTTFTVTTHYKLATYNGDEAMPAVSIGANLYWSPNNTYSTYGLFSISNIGTVGNNILFSDPNDAQAFSGIASDGTSHVFVAENLNGYNLYKYDVSSTPIVEDARIKPGYVVGTSTEVLRYQPNAIIQGTTLPDRDGTQDGVITWGTNPGDITVTNNPGSTPLPTPGFGGGSVTGILSNPLMPPQMYTELDVSKAPASDVIDSMLAIGGLTGAARGLWWFPFIFGIIAIVGLLVYGLTVMGKAEGGDGSLLLLCIVVEAGLVMFGLFGVVNTSSIIPLWPAFLFLLPSIALIISKKMYGW